MTYVDARSPPRSAISVTLGRTKALKISSSRRSRIGMDDIIIIREHVNDAYSREYCIHLETKYVKYQYQIQVTNIESVLILD